MKRQLQDTIRTRVRITGAFPEQCISHAARKGADVGGYRRVDELTVELSVRSRDLPVLLTCAKKDMCQAEILARGGPAPLLTGVVARPLFFAALLILTVLTFRLQNRLLFFEVSGNQALAAEQILWALEERGVGFLTDGETLDLGQLKNQLLSDLPELSWITVNTEGPYATVLVRERDASPAISRSAAPASLVAEKNGLITGMDVTGGTPKVRRGDVVKEGDLLVSGITNLERTTLLTRAEGEIYARTWNAVGAVLPENRTEKRFTGRERVFFALLVGKKTINFYKSSGISYRTYDKIIDTDFLTLPGGLAFPVGLARLTLREYEPQQVPEDGEGAETLLRSAVLEQLLHQMRGGQVRKLQTAVNRLPEAVQLLGVAACQEEIGRLVELKD